MPFLFLEHTADARIECTGRDFAEILESASEGLYAISIRRRRTDASIERRIHVTGNSREETLIRWLQELIFLLDAEHFVAAQFHFRSASELEAEVLAEGYVCPAEERAEEVKSATYQQLSVRETKHGLAAQVTFDL
jgi:SHS2 domain-containing protein